MSEQRAPTLVGDALDAAEYRGGHMQIIASAGSGKTEVVSQRVASLIAGGVPPASIVAFTFTERAAAELKARIARRVEERVGAEALDLLGNLFVGTIHAFCFRVLQTAVPRYETYDVVDPNQLTAFLVREINRLDIRRLDDNGKMFSSVEKFLSGVDVVENELIDPADVPGEFGQILRNYYSTLERYRLLTFGQQVVRAVAELARPEIADRVAGPLQHLIVDEYQDVNPAQEQLIRQLVSHGAHLCVVGDDDQAIYQWRGSDVANIIGFASRYVDVATFHIAENRRSRPAIVDAANQFATTINGRLPKAMTATRPALGGRELVAWVAETEHEEAGEIAFQVDNLHDAGVAYRDMAVLVRGKVAYTELLDHFAAFDIPVQPGGRSGLFDQPHAEVLGRTFAWLVDVDWGRKFKGRIKESLPDILTAYTTVFGVPAHRRSQLRTHLQDWKRVVAVEDRSENLIGEFYALLAELDVRSWDLTDPTVVNQLGTLARFSTLLTHPARSSAANGAESGTTNISPSTSSTTPARPTATSTANPTSVLTPSTCSPSTEPKASNGPSCSCHR